MNFELEQLPYSVDALAPHISSKTVEIHYRKHHAGYLTKLADEIRGKALSEAPLAEIVKSAPRSGSIYRNAAQVWNHTFYWNSLAPKGGGSPSGVLADLIRRDFGGVDNFKRRYAEAALGQFGSGWAWLVIDSSSLRLDVLATSNADNPMRSAGIRPLLTLDVWEHAYYLDFANERGRYIEGCLDNLLNWQFAETNYQVAAAEAEADELVGNDNASQLAAGSQDRRLQAR